MGCCLDALAIFVAVIIGLITLYKWKYSYWKRKNLPYVEPSIPFGTMENPFNAKVSFGTRLKMSYDELKSRGHKHGGLYNLLSPIYLPVEPEYVKNIMQKDFQYFVERGIYYNERDDPLSAHLFAIGGQKWRNLRTRLTPTFTSGKMKMMFETLVSCSHPMMEVMDKYTQEKKPIDIKEFAGRFTTDVIGSCAFGLDCNSFKDPDAEFRKYGKLIFARDWIRLAVNLIFLSMPDVGHFLRLRSFKKDTTDFFYNIVKQTVEYREANNISRKDMMQLLIELKNKSDADGESKHDGTTLTMEEVAAQAFVFFAAGFETSSTTMTFCLFELASNPEIQQKVRDEITHVLTKHGEEITYEAIMDMHYMNQVVDETLRKYPPVPQLTRKCVKDYKVPNSDLVLEKNTHVFISILGLHYDPEYFPNPEKFDPERFSPENRSQVGQFSYLPFGEGPRICIGKTFFIDESYTYVRMFNEIFSGLRFGMMQAKVGLAVLLKNYRFTLNDQTILPLEIDPNAVIYATKDTIWLNSTKINLSDL